MIDYLKGQAITGIFTHLAHVQGEAKTDAGLSSLMDAWILLLNREVNGEFNRELYILKARGIAHSNQVREFVMTRSGISLRAPYLGENGALTGSARRFEETRNRRAEIARRMEVLRLQDKVAQRRRRTEAQIEALQADLQADELELKSIIDQENAYLAQAQADAAAMAASRKADGG
jgi:circadian clock protein KaiC